MKGNFLISRLLRVQFSFIMKVINHGRLKVIEKYIYFNPFYSHGLKSGNIKKPGGLFLALPSQEDVGRFK